METSEGQKKTILIIKSKAQSLAAAETFLRNRDWKIFATDSLKDALAHLMQHKPAFVLVSVDHPNKKVRTLPKVLTQAFPVCVMSFAENSGSASFKALTDSGSEYLLYPPVTGPAVERTVNKYYKDVAAKLAQAGDAEKWKNSEHANSSNDPMISIKGGQNNEMMSFKSDASAQKLFAQMLGEEGAAVAVGIAPGDTSSIAGVAGSYQGSAYQATPGVMQEGHGSAEAQRAGGTSAGEVAPAAYKPDYLRPQGSSSSESDFGNTGSNTYNGSQGGFGNGPSGSGSAYAPGGQDGNGGYTPGSNSHGASYDSDPSVPEQERDYSSDKKWRRKQNDKGSWQAGDPYEKDPQSHGASSGFQRNKFGEESIFLKGTREALEKSVVSSKHQHAQPVQKIEESTNVACIVVESPRFSGYLVTALGKNRKIDSHFLKGVHDRLFAFLKANGEDVKREESMNIKIKQVPFEDWAMDCAEFLRKSVHNGDEVAMAFFPYAEAKVELQESYNSEMAAVSLKDLAPDKEVEMNLYVYLPTNNKYILYTPRGSKLYGKQKDKLHSQGVTHMHMLKAEADDLNKYRAQNYLNAKIEEFERNQKEKNKIKAPEAS